MDDSDWAWLAGIFEGEGCITFTGRNSVCLSVNMTDRDVVERCLHLTGVGSLYSRSETRGRAKTLWGWQIANQDGVRQVLAGIRPWLGNRRGARADAAIQRLANCRRSGYCKRGHRMSGENLYVSPGGQRMCRACVKIRESDRAARRREASPYPAVQARAGT